MHDPDLERIEIIVTGRVQGVAFRWYTVQEAKRLGLVGWVRNLSNGSVRMMAEGPRHRLEALLFWAGHGPDHARVDSCHHTWQQATGQVEDFVVTG